MNQRSILSLAILLLVVSSMSAVYALETTVSLDDYEILFKYGDVEEGDTFTLKVEINNTDDSSRSDVRFEIEESGPFEVDGDRIWEIGTLGSHQVVKRNFRIEVDDGTEKGDYDLEIELEDSKDDYQDDVEIEVLSTKADLIIGNVLSSPLTILPDQEDVKLEIQIDNLGGGEATFVRARLALPEDITSSNSFSDTFTVGTIASDGSQTLTFFIDTAPDIRTGAHPADIVLEYESDSKTFSKRLSFDIPVKGGPQFEVIASEVRSDELIPGGTGVVSITIQNIGSEDGKETSVRVFENADFPFDFDEKTNFVGMIKPKESGIALFNLEVDSDALVKTYLLKLQVRTISRGDVIVSEHTIPINISEPEPRDPLATLFMLVAIVILLALMYILYLIFRR